MSPSSPAVRPPFVRWHLYSAFFGPGHRASISNRTASITSRLYPQADSRSKGHLTFGEKGKVAYFNQVTPISLSEASSPGFTHHSVRLFDEPCVHTYMTPFTSTYPAWLDPSYWLEGVKPHFVLSDQLRAIGRGRSGYFRILSTEKQWIAGWLVLVLLAGDWRKTSEFIFRVWLIWLPSVTALALYALVLGEPKYVVLLALSVTHENKLRSDCTLKASRLS